jgi:hypothetical protein
MSGTLAGTASFGTAGGRANRRFLTCRGGNDHSGSRARCSGIVTLSDHPLDRYAVFGALCAQLPLAVWCRSEAALRWSLIAWSLIAWFLIAWFLSILAALFLPVLAPVTR